MKSNTKRTLTIAGGLVVVLGVSGAIYAGTTQKPEGTDSNVAIEQQQKTIAQYVKENPSLKGYLEDNPDVAKMAKDNPDILQNVIEESKASEAQKAQGVKQEAVTPSPTKSSTDLPTQSSDTVDTSKEIDVSERKQSDDKVTGEYKAGAVLISKYSILYNGQYQYIFELRLSNDQGSKMIKYYATKNSYDTANSGDTYQVTYGGDQDGNISVRTITK